MKRKGKYTKDLTRRQRFTRALKRRWSWFKRLPWYKKALLIAAPFVFLLIVIPLITFIYFWNDIADAERLMNRNNTGVVLLDRNGEAYYRIGRAEHRERVALEDISEHTKNALIATEDRNFYEHSGFSLFSTLRALYTNIMLRDATAYGGSTLTQQLAKNTLLSDDDSFIRKYRELVLSIAIEQRYSKDEILEMYLNSIFYGGQVFGIEEAARVYYDKTPAELNLAESSMLIGILPAPNAYSPLFGNMEYALERQQTVLTRMVTNGYITEEEKQTTLEEEIAFQPAPSMDSSVAPHYVEMVMNELHQRYGAEHVARSGYQIRTGLDIAYQRHLETAVSQHIGFIQANGGSNAGSIAIDPTNGEILALVGSADWDNEDWGKVNMTTAARQPGSSFKPIYVAGALAEGVVTPASILRDEATDFGGYTPRNADGRFRGDISLRNALGQSLNIPAVKVMEEYGVQRSIETANRLGIDSVTSEQDYGLSLSLGAAETPLVEMTNAYAAFANQGQQFEPVLIRQVNDKFDSTIYRASQRSETAISAQGAYLISSILSDSNARTPIFGNSLNLNNRTAAVKTGTTDSARDAWTIGYTPQVAVGVWVGNNDNAVMLNGGAGMAAPIWTYAMNQMLAGQSNEQFTVPSGVVQRNVCFGREAIASNSGDNTYSEYFLESAVPTASCEAIEDRPIEVCNTRNSRIITIDERDFDSATHSRNLDDCREDEEDDEPVMIQVCEIATGSIITINEDDFNSAIHSRDTDNCEPPEDDDDEPGIPGLPIQ